MHLFEERLFSINTYKIKAVYLKQLFIIRKFMIGFYIRLPKLLFQLVIYIL